MKTKVLINSKTSGKFKREDIDGRSHLVTTMMPIRGDITMNNIFYPDKAVEESFMQLNMLPAPNGHPTVNGVNVPAFHPVANNKHNIGGFLRNPRKKGKRVFVDFLLDEEIANNSEAGKETIRRIEAGERIGVSTGLGIAKVINKTGTDDFNKKYQRVGEGFHFDHVATLLNEEAAGSHAGTELILNEDEGEVLVYNAEWQTNELSTHQLHDKIHNLVRSPSSSDIHTWLQDIFPDSKTFIFSHEEPNQPRKLFKQTYAIDQNDNITLIDDMIEVVRKEEFIPKTTTTNQEVSDMDKNKIVLAIVGNSANNFKVADVDSLMAKTDVEIEAIVATNTLDENAAKELLTNSGHDFTGYDSYQTNKVKFQAFLEAEDETLKATVDNIVANSDYTVEMLEGKDAAELDLLTNMLTPEKIAIRGEQKNRELKNNSKESAVDYS